MKTIINIDYQHKQIAINQLVDDFFDKGSLIVKGSRNTIKSNILENETVNIKFFKKPGFIKSIIYSFFRSTKAKRSFDYANYLIKNKIQTPIPIAFIECRNNFGLLKDSFYICKQIDYDFTIRELIHNPLFENRKIILEQFDHTHLLDDGDMKHLRQNMKSHIHQICKTDGIKLQVLNSNMWKQKDFKQTKTK